MLRLIIIMNGHILLDIYNVNTGSIHFDASFLLQENMHD